MGNLGSGTGSGYPAALDYQATPEVNSPSAGMTKARAAVPNDLASAVVAIETELGTDPAGSTADVKTYLQVEHETDGTHKDNLINALTATTATTATNLSMNGEASATSGNATTTLDLGTVTEGDRIFVSAQNIVVCTADSAQGARLSQDSGTATIVFNHSQTYIHNFPCDPGTTNGTYSGPQCGVIRVTGTGNLVLKNVIYGSYDSITSNEIYAFFLKKA